MANKKFTYLFLALLVPGLIFVFLKFAGSNRFDVPVYPEEGTPLHSPCAGEVSAPYRLPDSVWSMMALQAPRQATVVHFPADALDAKAVAVAVIEEIGSEVTFVSMQELVADSVTLARWKSCVFLIESPRQAALIDQNRQLRGFYDLRNRDEVDRLRVELKILLEKY